jgi:T5SS/PEP-CTERM-associated repeat protein/autotransporter-associated beta strand protein
VLTVAPRARRAPIAIALAAVLAAPCALAAISTSGNITGGGVPYNGVDDPWATVDLVVGQTAPGTLAISAGSDVNNTGPATISQTLAASGSDVHVTGAGSRWTNTGPLYVGRHGEGTLTLDAGGVISTPTAYLGFEADGVGTVDVGNATTAGQWIGLNAMYVGFNGAGTLNITRGGISGGAGYIGANSGSVGVVNVGGGSGLAFWTGSLTVGDLGVGTLNLLPGGTVSVNQLKGNSQSSVQFFGGTLRLQSSFPATGNFVINSAGGTIEARENDDSMLSGAISGAGGLAKIGFGELTLSAANTYGGGTTIAQGRLRVANASGSATGAGPVNVQKLGLLRGAGSVAGPISIEGGVLAPGAGAGTLNVATNLDFASGATLDYEVNGNTSAADLLNVDGDLDIHATAKLNLINLGNAPVAAGTKLTAISYSGARSGQFAGHPDDQTNWELPRRRTEAHGCWNQPAGSPRTVGSPAPAFTTRLQAQATSARGSPNSASAAPGPTTSPAASTARGAADRSGPLAPPPCKSATRASTPPVRTPSASIAMKPPARSPSTRAA